MSNLYPVGAVLPYSGAFTPESENALIGAGYLPCDGRQLNQQDPQYVALFGVISTWYGGTDKTFCIPDYRGRFMRGTDYGAGRDPDAATRTTPNPGLQIQGNSGDSVGSLQPDGVQNHTHNYAANGGDYHHINHGGAQTPGVFAENQTAISVSDNTGGTETRPKNAYINYVIVFM